ncbi:hypothetical protein ACSBR2_036764 [Camellia fascicularis]
MASGEREFEEQLEEAGNRLLQPPSSVDELLPLLDNSYAPSSESNFIPTHGMELLANFSSAPSSISALLTSTDDIGTSQKSSDELM